MKNKIKFLNFDYIPEIDDLLEEGYIIVENPTTLSNVPDGEYLIRGDKKDHANEYYVINNMWILISTTTKDNGHYYCRAGTYQLFPNLPEKDWKQLNKVWTKLSPYWKRAVAGRNHYMEIRKIRRNIKKDFLSFNKECWVAE
ncbi:hypothetical protein M0Q97_07960 [Candidatus Dojkabacteria bacterium]|jgi:hypothetical protein|nr:hypothetical protein [Candidatus Dojkabacteria bacterium]